MYITIRNNKKFYIDSIEEKRTFFDSSYTDCVFLKGNCFELGLLNRTIVLTKNQYNKRIVI